MGRFKLSNLPRGELAGLLGASALILIAGFWAATQFEGPAPPDKVTITTGAEGGAYYFFEGFS